MAESLLPFEDLRIELPEYVKEDGSKGSPPFSTSKHSFFQRETLKSIGSGVGPRTEYFKKHLVRIFEQIGRPVPYRFTDHLGRERSMDGGCLKFVGPDGQDIAEFIEQDGYIVAVRPKPVLIPRYGTTVSVAADIELLSKDTSVSATERVLLIDARLGQGQFRSSLLAAWHSRCAITSCNLPAVLRASHIVPWRLATNAERLDPENGIPLLATLDALFDAGLISFNDQGDLLAKPNLQAHPNLVETGMRLSRCPSKRMQGYLHRHRRINGFEH
ncbi:HNH endonuclease protein [Rhizobium phaseoli]|uniref:HNH endonuclease n=1 Tax=Rhizobium phaseoli TaxID=396 RepID=UPI0007E9D0C4|nr:HNH endonuclease signature motif containing protein [Rhizobium phaseoli]ANL64762.1 HNH endonuclease protein [Rhizobium phaseoli]ANL77576.1 HNH endonuclease protein [Rhizobium phaseoli]